MVGTIDQAVAKGQDLEGTRSLLRRSPLPTPLKRRRPRRPTSPRPRRPTSPRWRRPTNRGREDRQTRLRRPRSPRRRRPTNPRPKDAKPRLRSPRNPRQEGCCASQEGGSSVRPREEGEAGQGQLMAKLNVELVTAEAVCSPRRPTSCSRRERTVTWGDAHHIPLLTPLRTGESWCATTGWRSTSSSRAASWRCSPTAWSSSRCRRAGGGHDQAGPRRRAVLPRRCWLRTPAMPWPPPSWSGPCTGSRWPSPPPAARSR